MLTLSSHPSSVPRQIEFFAVLAVFHTRQWVSCFVFCFVVVVVVVVCLFFFFKKYVAKMCKLMGIFNY